MSSSLLQADAVGRRSIEDGRWILRDATLGIRPGQRVAVFGPSGSGKSVLLRSLALLDPLDAGSIQWRGLPVSGASVPKLRRDVLYVHQRPALREGTVEDNLRVPFQLRIHRERRFDRDRILDWLDRLGRDESFLSKKHRNLSGGEAQLVALLRAVQLDPQILLLDEPTAALDAAASAAVERVVDLWFSEQQDHRAYVWVSHDASQVDRVTDIRFLMQEGRLSRERN